MKAEIHAMHYAIAEHGKLLALKRDYKNALTHYREAIRMAVSSKAPEVFFRHYTQCVLESLELTGGHAEIIEFCVNADAHYSTLNLSSHLHLRDHASVLERKGINEIKAGDQETGVQTLKSAQDMAGKKDLPLTDEVLEWAVRGYTIDTARLLSIQRKHNYFVVRRNQVNEKRARSIASLKSADDQGIRNKLAMGPMKGSVVGR